MFRRSRRGAVSRPGTPFSGHEHGERPGRRRRVLVFLSSSLLVVGATATSGVSTAVGVAGALPCDAFAAGSTPCVASYSSVRALFASYNGALYRVTRASDGVSSDIGLLAAGGYANAAAQDSFCSGTVCTITTLYDQSPNRNDLAVGQVGAAGSSNVGARADDLPVTVAGHRAYGILVNPRVGYFRSSGTGLAVNGQAESMYMVAGGAYATNACCFDFGNVEPSRTDTGAGHMDALIISTYCGKPPCSGVGPWIQADLENGVFTGNGSSNLNALSLNSPFVTAVLRNNGQNQYALDGGNATAATVNSYYSGALPSGYGPMHQEGAITLGTGGDNSNAAPGAFFEGAITSGYSSNATVASLQSGISSVTYSGTSGGGPGIGITGPGGKCVDVTGSDNGVAGTNVDISSCLHDAVDQHWQYIRAVPSVDGGSGTPEYVNDLKTLYRCLDIKGNVTTAGTQVELWDCNGVGGQLWVQQADGSLLNPQSGLCLDDPSGNTTNGTVLQIYTCNGNVAQKFFVSGGHPINAPGGKCVDVVGTDVYGNWHAPNVQMWDCIATAADQHWVLTASNTVETLTRCLDVGGNSSAAGTKVDLFNCNGVGGQQWVPQANGTLKNPQSGLCLTDPGGNTANGTGLDIEACTGAASQIFR